MSLHEKVYKMLGFVALTSVIFVDLADYCARNIILKICTHWKDQPVDPSDFQSWWKLKWFTDGGLTQVIDSDMHLKAIDGFCVRAHHHPGVVDEDMKIVNL